MIVSPSFVQSGAWSLAFHFICVRNRHERLSIVAI